MTVLAACHHARRRLTHKDINEQLPHIHHLQKQAMDAHQQQMQQHIDKGDTDAMWQLWSKIVADAFGSYVTPQQTNYKEYARFGRPVFKTIPMYETSNYDHTTGTRLTARMQERTLHALRQHRRATTITGLLRRMLQQPSDHASWKTECQRVANKFHTEIQNTDGVATNQVELAANLAGDQVSNYTHACIEFAKITAHYKSMYDDILRKARRQDRDQWKASMLDDPHHKKAYRFLKSGQQQPMVALRDPVTGVLPADPA